MNKITLTTRGKEILSQNTLQGGEVYWVGYFGLAYVPDQGGFSADQTRLISDTEHGDYIYNLWQGDLVNEGHSIQGDLDSNYSAVAKQISKLTLYDRNITSNFRYMYDEENDRNRMVTWVSGQNSTNSADSETSSYVRDGYRIYNGITMGDSHNTDDMTAESELPCPAPLFYAGGSVSYSNPLEKGDFVNSVVSNDWPLVKEGETEAGAYPRVTPDMRFYGGSWKGGSRSDDWKWIPEAAGKYDTIPSVTTRNSEDTPASTDCLNQYAEFISVSNFNKDHGHVSSEGYGVGYQESCHNMSMVTKLFPIANYELTATSDPATTDKNITERGSAKSIKYVIRLNLKAAYQGVKAYLDTLDYQKTETAGIAPSDIDLYTSAKPNSFKFNRIGIYAVRVAIRHFYKEGDASNHTDCRATHYQMEISPDAKPELFAVMQVDEVCMSEDGSFGLGDYNTTFVLNLENTPENTDLCTNPEVYYNLVENEAITWYQNQLIATAGLSEAVTNLGVNVAYLMNNIGKGGTGNCYGSDSDGTQYASIDHTHDYLKNLVDDYCKDGSVRDIMSANPQADPVPPLDKVSGGWSCGLLSFTMGDKNATLGDYSLNMSVCGAIDEESKHILLVGGRKELEDDGEKYVVVRNSDYSFIMGKPGEYTDIHNSVVMMGNKTRDDDGISGASNSLLFDTGKLGNTCVFEDSTVDFCGTDVYENTLYPDDEYLYPSAFRNVIWHGSARAVPYAMKSSTDISNEFSRAPIHDILCLIHDDSEHLLNDWLGHGSMMQSVYYMLKDASPIGEYLRADDIAQPYDAPMIFTGGIALGGHLMDGGRPLSRYVDYAYEAGMYGLLKLGTSYEDTYTASDNSTLYRNTLCPSLSLVSGAMNIYGPDSQDVPEYTCGSGPNPMKLYHQSLDNNQTYHYVVHTPHAGKPLVSAETQEIDGTLRMVLGQDYRYGNTGTTTIEAAYIAASDGFLRLTINWNAEHTYLLEAHWPSDDVASYTYDENGNSDIMPARYYTGESADTTSPQPKGTPIVTDSYSKVGLNMQYHWHKTAESTDTVSYQMYIDTLIILIPTVFPNYYIITGSVSGSGGKFTPGVCPTISINPCFNATDTNIFIDYRSSGMFDAYKSLMTFTAAECKDTGLASSRAVVKLMPSTVYRLSASNYHGWNGEFDSANRLVNVGKGYSRILYDATYGYPMRLERIPVTHLYNDEGYKYMTFDRVPAGGISSKRRYLDIDAEPENTEVSLLLHCPLLSSLGAEYYTIPGTEDNQNYIAVFTPEPNYKYILSSDEDTHGYKIDTVQLAMNDNMPENGEFWIDVVPGITLVSSNAILNPSFMHTANTDDEIVIENAISTPAHFRKIAVNAERTEFQYLLLSDGSAQGA